MRTHIIVLRRKVRQCKALVAMFTPTDDGYTRMPQWREVVGLLVCMPILGLSYRSCVGMKELYAVVSPGRSEREDTHHNTLQKGSPGQSLEVVMLTPADDGYPQMLECREVVGLLAFMPHAMA